MTRRPVKILVLRAVTWPLLVTLNVVARVWTLLGSTSRRRARRLAASDTARQARQDAEARLRAIADAYAGSTPLVLRLLVVEDHYTRGTASLDLFTSLRRARLQGACAGGAYDPADELLEQAWGLLAEAGIPVVIHCGSGPAPGKHTGPEPIAQVLARHPRLRLVVAHMGMPEYEEFLGLAERYGEVRLDTTMAFTDFTEEFMPFPSRALPRLAGLGDRILLGSDFPNIPYPYVHQLHALDRLGLGEEWLRAVCHDNAAGLFGL
ncbi:hypothetical protein SAURM35S_03666 [Streptomyces aurantiogriseus]